MKTRLVLALTVVGLMTTGFDCLNDPIIVSVFADSITGTIVINSSSNGQYNQSVTVNNIQDLIPSDYRDAFQGLRVYDIRISVEHPHPDGAVSGGVYIQLGSGAEQSVLTFTNIQYEEISKGVTLSSPGMSANRAVLNSLFAGITGVSTLPSTARIRAQVTSGPAFSQPLKLTVQVFLQLDAEL